MNIHDIISQHIVARYQNSDIIIVGLGREGRSSYQFFREFLPQAKMYLIDENLDATQTQDWQELLNTNANYEVIQSYSKVASKQCLALISPGIPPHSPLINELATLNNCQEHSNTNLFFELVELINQNHSEKLITTIGVTGTKGKSTTTSIIYHVLKETIGTRKQEPENSDLRSNFSQVLSTKYQILLAGNIGVPPLTLIPEITENLGRKATNPDASSLLPLPLIIVLELSSHHLSRMTHSPHIAVLQNISPEHLDYYPDFETYAAAKANITKFQTPADYFIYNSTFELPTKIAHTSKAKTIDVNDLNHRPSTIDHFPELQLKGTHNQLNILPSIAIAQLFNISESDLLTALKSFQPLEHRLQPVGTVNGVTYYNDSLSTTPESCIAAIQAFPNQQIVLIAGGYDRHLNFSDLAKTILTSPVKALILFNPTGTFIEQEIRDLRSEISLNKNDEGRRTKSEERSDPQILFVETMQQAVTAANKFATNGDIVLMSPASASFGRFKDYADRGNQFADAVKQLT